MSVDEDEQRPPSRRLPGATILQVVPALAADDAARVTLDVALALLRSGARAIVAGGDGPLVSELQGFGGEWVRLVTETTNPVTRRANVRVLEELISAERIDIVHARGIRASQCAADATTRTGSWLINTYAGVVGPRRWGGKAYGRALTRGARVIADSRYVADHVVERHQVSAGHVVVIARPVDTARFDPSTVGIDRVVGMRRAWKIGRGERIFLVPGTLDPANGQHTLVDAVRMLVSGGLHGVVFVLAGDRRPHADYARTINERAEAHGVGALIRQVGVCHDMPAAYAAADIVVVPAIEPPTFGRLAAEGFAMARPVVASAVGALPEIVVPGSGVSEERTGWLCAPDDPDDLARALAAAEAVDAVAHRALSAAAFDLATRRFAPARVAAETLAVYASVLETGP